MLNSDEQLAAVAEAFGRAALGGDWDVALNIFADACGAERGELIGVGADAAVPFNWLPRTDPAILTEFEALGGGSPLVNPRVRAGMRMAPLQVWHEVQCSTPEELRRNFVYADFARRWDIPYGSQTNVLLQDGMLVGLAVLRGEAAGVPQAEDRRAFEVLSPHVRAAVLTQMAVEGQGAALISGALEAVGAAAFVLDGLGRVRAMTPAADAAARRGSIRLSGGRLGAVDGRDGAALAEAIRAATSGLVGVHRTGLRTVVLRTGDSPAEVEIADVVTLPSRPYSFGFQPRTLVVIRGAERARPGVAAVLGRAYGLTAAEADIALAIAEGETREEIATRRRASLETIRSQLKTVFAKLGVNRESQLVGRMRRFL